MTTAETPHAPVTALLKVFRRLKDRHPDMTLLQAMCLLHVANHPGITQTALYDALDSNDSTVSRTLAIISDIGDRKNAGLNLVKMKVDAEDRRRRLLSLTPKGQRLVAEIVDDLTAASKTQPA